MLIICNKMPFSLLRDVSLLLHGTRLEAFNTVCRIKQLEGKLATLTVINGALQNENETLRHDLAAGKAPKSTTETELHEMREEFTRRLAAAEKTIASLRVCLRSTGSFLRMALA